MAIYSAPAWSQSSQLSVPQTFSVPNRNRIFPGLWEQLEAGAALVRVNDSSAIWYNPAGIVLSNRSQVSANAPSYAFTKVDTSGVQSQQGSPSLRALPTYFGAVLGGEVIPWRNVRVGFGISNPISWTQGLSASAAPNAGLVSEYSVNSDVESFEGQGALAYAPLPNLRFGVSVGMSYDTLASRSQTRTQLNGPTYSGSLNSATLSANTQQLVSALGVQYEPFARLSLGALVRAPAVRLFGSSSLVYDGILNLNNQEQQVHLSNDGSFQFELPAQISLGAATHFDRFNLEADLTVFPGNGTYNLLSPASPFQLVRAGPGGQAPLATTVAFPGVVASTRTAVDANVGGNYRLDSKWWLHGGVYTDQSPVAAADNFFQAIDFYGLRVGCSLRQQSGVSGSLGLGYELGLSSHSPPAAVPVFGPLVSPPGTVVIHNFNLLFAISLRF